VELALRDMRRSLDRAVAFGRSGHAWSYGFDLLGRDWPWADIQSGPKCGNAAILRRSDPAQDSEQL